MQSSCWPLSAGWSHTHGHGFAIYRRQGGSSKHCVSTDQSELTEVIHSNFVHGSRDYKPSMALTHACMCDQMGREGL